MSMPSEFSSMPDLSTGRAACHPCCEATPRGTDLIEARIPGQVQHAPISLLKPDRSSLMCQRPEVVFDRLFQAAVILKCVVCRIWEWWGVARSG